ncbi:MAG: PDZ domain-containing protein [Acidobacteria bacterium]|nr:PDZ domain-containing protein [Acidobacteriota bacterium]
MRLRPILLAALFAGLAVAVAAAADLPDERTDRKVDRRVVVKVDGDEPELFQIGEKGGFLGVGLTDLTPELREHFGAPQDSGVMVSRVEKDSPAEKAGVQVGDIILSVGGENADSPGSVRRTVRAKEEGDNLELQVLRDGKRRTLSASVVTREMEQFDFGDMLVLPDGKNLDFKFNFDPKRMQELGERLNREFNSPEFRNRIREFRLREGELEQKMKDLEQRLQELEKQLQEKHSSLEGGRRA